MQRREFLQGAAVAGVDAALSRSAKPETSRQADRRAVVVDGLNGSALGDELLDKLNSAGVHSIHYSMSDEKWCRHLQPHRRP